MDFEYELNCLLEAETRLPDNELVELAELQIRQQTELKRTTADLTLQIEEIYDIVKENEDMTKITSSAQRREETVIEVMMALNDLVENFARYTTAEYLKQAEELCVEIEKQLNKCGLKKIGKIGEPLNSKLHTVKAAGESSQPFEHVAEVLRSGYEYNGKIIKKAIIIVSASKGSL